MRGAGLLPFVAIVPLLVTGCVNTSDGPIDDDDDSAAPGDARTHAAVTTTDFSVGALAKVELDTRELTDEVTATSSDPVVRADGGLLFVINRYMFDSVRVYEPPDLQMPRVEFSTGAGSNPHDAAHCSGAIFVARYDLDSIGVYDIDTGIQIDEVDLSGWADEDGLPEASTLVRRGTTLYVGLQRMVREGAFWTPANGGGAVVAVDCETRDVVNSWTTGPNVFIQPHPMDDDALLLLDGIYWDPSGEIPLDGGVHPLPLEGQEPGDALIDEAMVGGNIVAVAADEAGRGLLVSADADQHHVHCVDLISGTTELILSSTAYIPSVQGNDRGEAWVVMRAPYDDPGAGGGLAVYDMDTCEQSDPEPWISTSLEPFSIDFY